MPDVRTFPPAQHLVAFYQDPEALCLALTGSVLAGIRSGEQIVLIVTRPHWTSVEARLRVQQVQVGRLLQRRQIVVVDAEEVLAQVTADGPLDLDRLQALLESLLDPALAPHRVFGELVSLLAARGHFEEALKVEKLGMALASRATVTVACAYDLAHLRHDPEAIDAVAACHERAVSV